MKILVTGGAGFIGSNLIRQLIDETDYDVVNLDKLTYAGNLSSLEDYVDHERYSFVQADLCDPTALREIFQTHQPDAVMHLAAESHVDRSIDSPGDFIHTNILGTYHLLQACRINGVKNFVFASSSSIYGGNPKVPFAEGDLIERTISPNASTKLAGEQLCSNYSHLYGIYCKCLRFFTVYGPRQRPDLAIAKFTAAIMAGNPIDQHGP